MRILGLLLCIVLSSRAFATPGQLLSAIPNPDAEPNAHFGAAVSPTGNTDQFVVGAPDAATSRGKVYVYSSAGQLLSTIQSPYAPGQNLGNFGATLGTYGTGFVAGVPGLPGTGGVAQYSYNSTLARTYYGTETGYGSTLWSNYSALVAGNPTAGDMDYGAGFTAYSSSSSTFPLTPNAPTANMHFASSAMIGSYTGYVYAGAPDAETQYPGGHVQYFGSYYYPSYYGRLTNPGGTAGDRFGAALASGVTGYSSGTYNYVFVGAPGTQSSAGRAYAYSTNGTSHTLALDPPPNGGGEFGASLATFDTYLAVGCPGYDAPGAPDSGRVYLYAIPSGQLMLTLDNPTPAAGDRFGQQIAFFGGNLVVGVANDDTAGQNSGAIYTMAVISPPTLTGVLEGTSTVHLQWENNALGVTNFILQRTIEGGGFANVATLSSGTFSYTDEGLPPNTSICYRVYANTLSGVTGYSNQVCLATEHQPVAGLLGQLDNPSTQSNALFGYAVAAIGKKHIAVGAPGKTTQAGYYGAVHIYNSKNLELERTIVNPRNTNLDLFGSSLGALGEDLLVGAPGTETTFNGGFAYRFSLKSGDLLTSYTNPSAVTGAKFGFSVAGFGKTKVMIGAPLSSLGAPTAGALYIESPDGELLDTLYEPHLVRTDQFGYQVAATKKAMFATAPFSDVSSTDRGTVSAFDKDGFGLGLAVDAFSVAAAGNYALVGAPGDQSGSVSPDYGYAYLFDGTTVLRVYVNPAAKLVDAFGYAVAGNTKQVLVGAPRYDVLNAESVGRAYLLDQRSGAVQLIMENPDIAVSDRFGNAVALFGKDKALVGAPYDGATDTGAVYVFSTAVSKKKK